MRIGEALIRDATKITRDWTKFQKRQIRSYGRAVWRPPRQKKDSIKDIAWRVMREAYLKAAGQTGKAAPRQVFYVARPLILAELEAKELSSVYFTQTLLPDYIAAHPTETADWDLLWDDRGHFSEPHTGTEIGLGTLAVRSYLAGCAGAASPDTVLPGVDVSAFVSTRYSTQGPRNRYTNVLLIEKEGFTQLLEHARIKERYDLAIMSSKGMNTTAARTLVEKLPGVRFLVLHDLDKAGFSILGTLRRSTRRYQFHRQADVVDLGIRLDDVTAEGLASEPVHYPGNSKANLRQNGASAAEIAFMVQGQQRVELNAFDSDHFIEWLERKLIAHDVAKVIPDEATLAIAYRRATFANAMNATIEKGRKAARDKAAQVSVPEALPRKVRRLLKAHPAMSWDVAVASLASPKRSARTNAAPEETPGDLA